MSETETRWALPFSDQTMLRAQRAHRQLAARGLHRAAIALASRFEAMGEAIAAALLRRHLRRLLRALDHRTLDDIGIDSADIDEIIWIKLQGGSPAEPLWRKAA